ncbi:MAG: cation transporter [Bacteroidetes bacterium]|nr:cation transporter [Bacteroidota bacterium]
MKIQEFKIEGMSCQHCVMAVKKELNKIENIKVEDVQIGSAKVQYDENKISDKILIEAIEEAGYKVVD